MSEAELSREDQLVLAHAVRADIDAALAEDSWCHLVVPRMQLEWARMFAESPVVARRLRGRLMRTPEAYEAEVSAALQLPEYYEDYPNAFDECLADLDWLPTSAGYLLLVTRPEEVLADTADPARLDEQLRRVVAGLAQAAAAFAQPVDQGDDEDRPALSFDVVLLADADHSARVEHLWRQAGAPL